LGSKKSWQARKEDYLKNLENDNYESLMICAADKIHNLKSMMRIYQEQGEEMWKDFNAPVERQIWYYASVIQILKNKLKNT